MSLFLKFLIVRREALEAVRVSVSKHSILALKLDQILGTLADTSTVSGPDLRVRLSSSSLIRSTEPWTISSSEQFSRALLPILHK